MAGPRIPEWQNVQGIQEGGMSAAYDKAGALFTTAIQAGQNILDDKVKRESAEAMEGILGSDNREELGEAQEAARSNVWADQTRVTEAGLGQKEKFDTKDIVDEERVYTRDRHTTQDTLAQQKADDTAAYQKESNRINAERNKEDAKIRWAELDARNAERKAAAARVQKASAAQLKQQQEFEVLQGSVELSAAGFQRYGVSSGSIELLIDGAGKQLDSANNVSGAPKSAAELEVSINGAAARMADQGVAKQIAAATKLLGKPLTPPQIKLITEDVQAQVTLLRDAAIKESYGDSTEGQQAFRKQRAEYAAKLEEKDAKQHSAFINTAQSIVGQRAIYAMRDTLTAGDNPKNTATDSFLSVADWMINDIGKTNQAGALALQQTASALIAGGAGSFRDAEKMLAELRKAAVGIHTAALNAETRTKVGEALGKGESIESAANKRLLQQMLNNNAEAAARKYNSTVEVEGNGVTVMIEDDKDPMSPNDPFANIGGFNQNQGVGGTGGSNYDYMGNRGKITPEIVAANRANREAITKRKEEEREAKRNAPLSETEEKIAAFYAEYSNKTPIEDIVPPSEFYTPEELAKLSKKDKAAIKAAEDAWKFMKIRPYK